MKITNCRFCNGKLSLVLSLGKMPLVNYFPVKKQFASEHKYPLELCVCTRCGLAQLGFIIKPEKMFRNYHFVTSASKPLISHLEALAGMCIKRFKLNKRSKVLDIGCNDGSLLAAFAKKQMMPFGVEPALEIAEFASARGMTVIPEFFNKALARKILAKHGKFDLICATRVLANVFDINDFMRGVKLLLAAGGVFVVEVSSLPEMLKKFQFDVIYHEHYSYFSFSTLKAILKKHGMAIFKLEKNLFQGGELRIFATHQERIKNQELGIMNKDIGVKIRSRDYTRFARNVLVYQKNIQDLFNQIRGAKIVGFGAPAKSVTLLNYCKLGKKRISFIVDSTPLKQGRFLPGLHIPIYPEDYLRGRKFDYCVLLAWNYKKQILPKIKRLVRRGVRVIIPFPQLEIITL